jgi:hypothetical protein
VCIRKWCKHAWMARRNPAPLLAGRGLLLWFFLLRLWVYEIWKPNQFRSRPRETVQLSYIYDPILHLIKLGLLPPHRCCDVVVVFSIPSASVHQRIGEQVSEILRFWDLAPGETNKDFRKRSARLLKIFAIPRLPINSPVIWASHLHRRLLQRVVIDKAYAPATASSLHTLSTVGIAANIEWAGRETGSV